MEKGANVLGIDKCRNPFVQQDPENIFKNYRHIRSSLDPVPNQLRGFLSSVPIAQRGVFHFAGLAEAEQCQQDPAQAFKLNVELTLEILELCRQIGGAKFVFPSTGMIYGDQLKRPATEEDRAYQVSVYAATKLSAEAIVQSYAVNFSCSAMIARLSNIYGPSMSEKTVIGKILLQIVRGDRLQVFDERPVRDFIFVKDVAEALIRLYACNEKSVCSMTAGLKQPQVFAKNAQALL